MFVPHREHTYGPPRPVTAISLLSYVWMMISPLKKRTCRRQRLFTGVALHFAVLALCERHGERMGEKRNVYRLSVGKPEGKRPLRRPRRRWIDNVNINLLEIGLSVVN
jgi:hypothetical protein